jgi:radical SAM family uncharacterized protein/radical SAM-linked protein
MSEMPHPYEPFLKNLLKPARYTGGEVGETRRAWDPEVAKVCLAFPDVYDIGMSHLGFKILYKLLNDDPRTLAERCYAPWGDLEQELRARKLPLVSLESKRPLSDFDVVGFSLQFELTYTNILNMLELGGVPLLAKDRGDADPLVLAGGPVATHPEPIAPFLDAVVIGDGEEKATAVATTWKRLALAGVPRRERLLALAALGAVYVPSLYETERCDRSLLDVVARPTSPDVPFPVKRALVDLAEYPFPDVSPTGGPEAIFDRMSIEIARGCTEGCRFCQAGMIYRPVRERDPQEIVDTVVRAIEKSGQDEVSLTALSTADVSCISPLVKKVNEELKKRRVSLGVSSLRAYGLPDDLLDEIKTVRATGLTFAPEAGTQRMRDVINKNVTEEQMLETAERVFAKGWSRMKLYFICGLPTETDEDVRGIVETGARALQVGRRAQKGGKGIEVTVSVSVHVPKPHTPFQWCAMDDLETVQHKQQLLREEARKHRAIRLKTHDADASVIEGAFARGDRRLADVLLTAFRGGARFDSWDDQLRLDLWADAFAAHGLTPEQFLGTLPLDGRLPWDHIDVGLEDGFLETEYKKALQSRLSPPCGKVAGTFVHATNLEDARAETRRLVCYDCGIACDMSAMRQDRITFLERLGATSRDAGPRRLPVFSEGPSPAPPSDQQDAARGAPTPLASASEGPSPASHSDQRDAAPTPLASAAESPSPAPPSEASVRVRFWFEKTDSMALVGHLDMIREIPRVMRRAGVKLAYTKGFHPKPDMTFAPALALGIPSFEEAIDMKLALASDGALPFRGDLAALCQRLTEVSPRGLVFLRAEELPRGAPSISSRVVAARYAIAVSHRAVTAASRGAAEDPRTWVARRVTDLLAKESAPVRRESGGLAKTVDVRSFLSELRLADDGERATFARTGFGPAEVVVADLAMRSSGSARPLELRDVLFHEIEGEEEIRYVRLGLVLGDEARPGPVAPPPPKPASASIGVSVGAEAEVALS